MVPIHSKGDVRSVPVRPLVRLARGGSIECVVGDLTEIAAEKGIDLYGIRVLRTGQDREFGNAEGAATDPVRELKICVEGGQTQLVLKLRGSAPDAVTCELEDAALLAAHRIELLAGRKLRVERAGQGRELSPVIEGLIGASEPMQRLREAILTAAGSISTVLITGESGTGKEIAAQAIHRLSRRAKGPFIAVNCGALPESLVESELFGHERGAFTGADRLRKGRFELAHAGTLFLDEAGELTPPAQVKLLRALQERRFERVGGAQTVTVDVRVIAATNRDLGREVAERRFRHDLYYRLHVLSLRTPSLREHPADIPLLVDHFLDLVGKRLGFCAPPEIGEEALDLLCRYRWPGNVRELEAMIERLSVEAGDGGVIGLSPVRRETEMEAMIAPGEVEYRGVLRAGETLAEYMGRHELEIYQMVRARCGGSHARAAQRLGVNRTTLYDRLKRDRQRLA
ncbi:MAG: sigma-54 interaction domain-containing protein, partial [Blastocatellia bacterium]